MDNIEARLSNLETRLDHLERSQAKTDRLLFGEWVTGTPALIERLEAITGRLDAVTGGIMQRLGKLESRFVWLAIATGSAVAGLLTLAASVMTP